jgi:uncharacterized protein YkwD
MIVMYSGNRIFWKNFCSLVLFAMVVFCAFCALPASKVWAAGAANEIFTLMNRERQKAGLPALRYDAPLSEAALRRAKELKNVCDHTRPDGSNYDTVFSECGVSAYKTSGENILWGSGITAADAVAAWMESPGHRANILNRSFTHASVGLASNDGETYYVQLFLGR